MQDPRDILRKAAADISAGNIDFASLEQEVTANLLDNAGFTSRPIPEEVTPTVKQRKREVAPVDRTRDYASRLAQTVTGLPIHQALLKAVPKKGAADDREARPSGAWSASQAAPLGLNELAAIARATMTQSIAQITRMIPPQSKDVTGVVEGHLLATPRAEARFYQQKQERLQRQQAAREVSGDESFFEQEAGPERDFETRAREYSYYADRLRSRAQHADARRGSSGDSPLSQKEYLENQAYRFEQASASPLAESLVAFTQGLESGSTLGIYDAMNPVESPEDTRNIGMESTAGVISYGLGTIIPTVAAGAGTFSLLRQSARFASLPPAQQSMLMVTAIRSPQAIASVASENLDPTSASARLATEVLGAGLIPGVTATSAALAQAVEKPVLQTAIGATANVLGQSAIGLGQTYAQTFGEGISLRDVAANIAQQIGFAGSDVQPLLRSYRAQGGGSAPRAVTPAADGITSPLENVPLAEVFHEESQGARPEEVRSVPESAAEARPEVQPAPETPPIRTNLEEVADAITTRQEPESNLEEYRGVQERTDVPEDQGQVRQEESGQAGGGGSAEPSPEVAPPTSKLVTTEKLVTHKTKSGAKRRGLFLPTLEEALRYDPRAFLVKDKGYFVDASKIQRQVATTQPIFTHVTRTGKEHEGAIVPITELGTTPVKALKAARDIDPGAFRLKGGFFISKEYLTRPEGFVEGANVSRPRLPLPAGAIVREPPPPPIDVTPAAPADDPFPTGNHPIYGEHADLQQASASTLRVPERKKTPGIFSKDTWASLKHNLQKGVSGISEKKYPVAFEAMRKIQRGMQIQSVDVTDKFRDAIGPLSKEELSLLNEGLKVESTLDELQSERVTSIAEDIYSRFKKTRDFDAFASSEELAGWGIRTPESDEMGRAAAQELAHRVYERDGVSTSRYQKEDDVGIAPGRFPGAHLTNQKLRDLNYRWARVLETNPNIKQAYDKYTKYYTDTVNEYADSYAKIHGAPPAFTREKYTHHMVLDLMDQGFNAWATAGKQVAKKARGLHEARVANDYLISGDIISAQMIALTKLKADTQVYNFLHDTYQNISKPVVDQAKADAARATEELGEGADPLDWKMFIPDGYQVYAPSRFSTLHADPAFLADPVVNDFQRQLGQRFKERTGLNIFELRGKYKALGDELILPDEFVEGFRRTEEEQFRKRNPVEVSTGAFKKWVLMNPWGAPKYNIRNFLGDLNKFFFNPGAGKHLGRAASEIKEYLINGKIASEDFRNYALEGGVEGVFNVQEDIVRDPVNGRIEFRLGPRKATEYGSAMERIMRSAQDLTGVSTDETSPLTKQAYDTYVEAVNRLSNGREMLLRYANYLEYVDQINSGELKNYGSSRKEAVDALPTTSAKAYKLSNELMGAYDEVSKAGVFLARNVFPFFRYKESNMRSYLGALRNGIEDAVNYKFVTKAGQNALGRAGRAALPIAYNVGKVYLKMQALQAAAELLFNLPQQESEKKLPKNIRRDSHLVLPFGGENMTAYFNRISTAEDFLETLGLQSLGGDAFYYTKQVLTGDMTADQAFSEWSRGLPLVDPKWHQELINTWMQGANPYPVTLYEMITQEHTFPNVFERRPYYDTLEPIISRLGTPAVRAYRALFPGTEPQRKFNTGEFAKELLFYNIENDYAELQDMKSEVMEYRRRSEKNFTPKYPDKLPYYLRNSLKYKDPESFLYFLGQYVQEKTNTDFDISKDHLVFKYATDDSGNLLPDVNPDGTKNIKALAEIIDGIQSTLKSYSPFAGASSEVQQAFISQASEGVKRKLDHVFKTIESYKQGDNTVSKAIESIFLPGDARTLTLQRIIKEGFKPIKRPKGLPIYNGQDTISVKPAPPPDTLQLFR